MQVQATQKSAFATGIYSGVIVVGLGPIIDNGGATLLILAVLAVAGPAYFYVFGVRREDMVGAWIVRPDLVKRIALCCLGVGCVAAAAQFLFVAYDGIVK